MLDTTQWTSSTDAITSPRPVITLFSNPGGRFSYVSCGPTVPNKNHLPCLPADPAAFEVYFENKADLLTRYPPLDNVIHPFLPELWPTVNLVQFSGEDKVVEYYAVGMSPWLQVSWPASQGSAILTTFRMFVPYCWEEKDLAEIIFAWTRFHSGGGTAARDALHKQSFLDHSSAMQDPFRRQRFTLYREIDRSLGEMIEELIGESNALAFWGDHTSQAYLTLNFGLRSWRDVKVNTAIYEAVPGDTALMVTRPIVRVADEYLLNRLTIDWGTFVRIDASGTPTTCVLQSPPTPIENLATLVLEDAASQTAYGLRAASARARWVMDRNSAEGEFRVERWKDLRRAVELAMGPLHFDFCVGDAIHVKDTFQGLSGSENLLVAVKEYDWNTLTASVVLVEMGSDAFVMDPTGVVGQNPPDLIAWFKAGTGITSGAGKVTQWDNQATAYPNAVTRGGGFDPNFKAAYRNGLDCVEFDDAGATALGLKLTMAVAIPRSYWTLICILDVKSIGTARRPLMSWTASVGPVNTLHQNWDATIGVGWNGCAGTPASATGWQVLIMQQLLGMSNRSIQTAYSQSPFWDRLRTMLLRIPLAGQAAVNLEGHREADKFAAIGVPYDDLEVDRIGYRLESNVRLGCFWDDSGEDAGAVMGDLVLFNQARGARPLSPRELEGIIAGMKQRLGF